jgi:hypothetical protein
VQAAYELGAQAAQIAVAASPQLQHCGVIFARHVTQLGRAQRGDGDRAGIVRVVLVHLPGVEQPHPRGQLRLHIHNAFTGADQLLPEQLSQTSSALDRPRALRPNTRPAQQLINLPRRSPDPQLTQPVLPLVEHHRGVRSLMRVDTDDHASQCTSHVASKDAPKRRPRRARLISGRRRAPLSSHATARYDELAPR